MRDKVAAGGPQRRFTLEEVAAARWRDPEKTWEKSYGRDASHTYRLQHGMGDTPSPLWDLKIFRQHFFSRFESPSSLEDFALTHCTMSPWASWTNWSPIRCEFSKASQSSR